MNVSSLDGDAPEIGVLVGEVTLWQRGVGRQAVALVLRWLESAGYKKSRAFVVKDNPASIRLFESLGFSRAGEGVKGEWCYVLNI